MLNPNITTIDKTILITGAANFIGFNLTMELIRMGAMTIVGLDNLNDYYDVSLK